MLQLDGEGAVATLATRSWSMQTPGTASGPALPHAAVWRPGSRSRTAGLVFGTNRLIFPSCLHFRGHVRLFLLFSFYRLRVSLSEVKRLDQGHTVKVARTRWQGSQNVSSGWKRLPWAQGL